MRKSMVALGIMGLVLFTVSAPAEENTWFDVKGCAICKNFGAEKGLMENVSWETHVISNGMLAVVVIPDEYAEKYARATKSIEATVAKMEGGEQMHLCGFCMSYGMLMMSGAQAEEIETDAGHISLMTSTNPEVVAKIQDHARRTEKEYARFQAEMKSGS